MTDIMEGCGDARGHLDRVAVPGADEAADDGARIASLVEWLQAALAETLFLAIQVGAIVFLKASRIFQHHRGEIGGRASHMHVPSKLMFGQYRQRAGVVDMGM